MSRPAGVASEQKFALMDIVMSAVGKDVTVLFVEQDMDIVAGYANRVLAFYDGKIIADGNSIDRIGQRYRQDLHHRRRRHNLRQGTMLRVCNLQVSISAIDILRNVNLEVSGVRWLDLSDATVRERPRRFAPSWGWCRQKLQR